MRGSWYRRVLVGAIILAAVLGVGFGLAAEMRTSHLQAWLLSSYARTVNYRLEPHASLDMRLPAGGPYDERLGYTRLSSFIASLAAQHFTIEQQAQQSPRLRAFIDDGGFAVYHEKASLGLTVLDRAGTPIFAARFPQRLFDSFDTVPRVVVDTLLFIENGELLDPQHPTRNPAIEWDRLGAAGLASVGRLVDPDQNVPGGSTLATQIEKYRHSLEGRTTGVTEKLQQMASASLRAYLDGPDTTAWRRQLVVDHLNSTPLGARPGYGEVVGLGDGLWVWYGTDLATANRVLSAAPSDVDPHLRAQIYKQVLSLLLAQRRPTYYLMEDRQALTALTDRYLRLLNDAGIIDAVLAEGARVVAVEFRTDPPSPAPTSFVDRKAPNAVRARLLSMLNLSTLYALDRLDLTVHTTLDAPAQERVTEVLRRLGDPRYLDELQLTGTHLLDRSDPSQVLYSFTLYERGAEANYLRIQADNLDQPLDINDGMKLDLGSTAKLRTLITYLEIVARLHDRLNDLDAGQLQGVAANAPDALTRWAAQQLATATDRSLPALLDAATARRYSAGTGESFFTGSGLHQFANFDPADDGRVMSVAEAFRNSVNLVFIRLMRDIVAYYIADGPTDARALLGAPGHPLRRDYLVRFADKEGQQFLYRFYDRYRGLTPDAALALLASRVRPKAERLAVIYRSVRPLAGTDEFAPFLRGRLPDTHLDDAAIVKLYAKFGPSKFSLADRGYIASIHPLELWLVEHLQRYPGATWADLRAASVDERQAVYGWLFKTERKRAQDTRIRIVLEEEAFRRIHREWQRLGYPFDRLVPSYATALGTSGDRPAALAELIGIILSNGIRWPSLRIDGLNFAAATPYETVLGPAPTAGERVMRPEVAATVRRALIDVVENGTARRVKGAIAGVDGAPLPIGGKTGTGDLRFERFGPGGRLVESRVVARTATFVFFIGDRFFGTVTAYVAGPRAAEYHFTSALAAQLFKALAPTLQPRLDRNVDLAAGQPRLGSTMTMASEAGAAATAPPAASAPATTR
jgi:membrane peptidoglycan carboxypeptidase